MTRRWNRRAALGLGGAAAAAAVVSASSLAWAGQTGGSASSPARTPQQACGAVRRVYQAQSARAGGTWNSYVSLADPNGTLVPAVQDKPDVVVQAYSVNKVAVAMVLLDKVDRGLLTLDQQVQVSADIVIPGGDGIFSLDGAYPSTVALGHVLAALLTVSDDTAVRLCGLLTTSAEINTVLAAKGFPNTRVQPVANPHRFYLGTTTPRETHTLLHQLVQGSLLSAASTAYLFGLLRSPIAFTDGIRRTMSSDERARIATKAGWFADGRNEAGIIFDTTGRPVLIYALFAAGQSEPDNFGATHPAVQARAVMGRQFLDAVDNLTGPSGTRPMRTRLYRPSNGG